MLFGCEGKVNGHDHSVARYFKFIPSSKHQINDKTDLQTGFHSIDFSGDWRLETRLKCQLSAHTFCNGQQDNVL